MSDYALNRFSDASNHLLETVAELRHDFPSLVQETADARDEAVAILQAALTESTLRESAAIYEEPIALLGQTSQEIVQINEQIHTLVHECLRCSSSLKLWLSENATILERINPTQGASPEESWIIAQWRAAIEPGRSTWAFFSALPTLALCVQVTKCRDAVSAFLGRPPGRRYDFRAGITALIEGGGDALIDAATFNFGSVLLRATEATFTPPVEQDCDEICAANARIERAFRLAAALRRIKVRLNLVNGLVAVSESAVVDSVACIEQAGTSLTEMLHARLGKQGDA